MTDLVVEEVSTPEALAALKDDWRALAAAHGEGLPFRTWEWNDAWWRWFGEHRAAVRDALFVRAFRTTRGQLVGVAPLTLVSRPGVGLALLRGLEFFGADPYVTELRGALVDPAWEGDVYTALGEHLDASRAWDWIRWQGLKEHGTAARLVRDGYHVALDGETPAYRLKLEGTWDSFRASRPRNLKESLRKCYNSLKKAGHAFELTVARTPAEVPAALDRFLELHSRRATADGLLQHGNVFRDHASRGFFLDVCNRLAARDAMRIFQLRIAGEVVASRVGFALDGTLYLYFSGYDPDWAPFSVMTTTVAEALRYAFENGFAYAHLSTGTDESKLRWRPERENYHEGIEYARGLRGVSARWLRGAIAAGSDSRFGAQARWAFGRRRGE